MEITTHAIKHLDGAANELTVFHASTDVHAVYLILPAMGVKASYYKQFSSAMAEAGLSFATMDWRGNDRSSERPSHTSDWGYGQLLTDTFDACKYLQMRLGFARIFLFGHSMGGQIAHLFAARHPKLVTQVVTIASSDPYCMKWPLWQVPVIYAMTFIVYPFSKLFGYFPGQQIGFARSEAMTVMGDWARGMRKGYFEPTGDDFDYVEAKSDYYGLIRTIGVPDDFLAPQRAIEYTLGKFPKAKTSYVELPAMTDDGEKISHFNWVKHHRIVMDLMLTD